MTIDVETARRETPGCAHVLHLDNAGSSLPPTPVIEAVSGHLALEARIGGYEAAREADEAIEHAYDAAATLLSCHRDEIAFVESATRAWGAAFYALPFAPGDRVLTAEAEYASNYIAFLQLARTKGIEIEPVPSDEQGQISITALEEMIDRRVKLIAVTHVPTNGGLVNPAAEVGRVARAAGVPYLLDACQSVGQMPIDVEAIGCDMLSATGRKYLRGPRGTGFLYVRRAMLERLEPPFLDMHGAEWVAPDRYEPLPNARRFENFEGHVAGKIGLGVAIDYAAGWGLDAIGRRVGGLAATLRETLAALPGVTVQDIGARKCGIVTFTVAQATPLDVRDSLYRQGINVSVSRKSSTLLDMTKRGLDDVVRASLHYYNTEEELARFCGAVAALA